MSGVVVSLFCIIISVVISVAEVKALEVSCGRELVERAEKVMSMITSIDLKLRTYLAEVVQDTAF